jgi:hypothetical protein
VSEFKALVLSHTRHLLDVIGQVPLGLLEQARSPILDGQRQRQPVGARCGGWKNDYREAR